MGSLKQSTSFFLLCSLSLLVQLTYAQGKLVKTKATDEITVKIPASWRPMDAMDLMQRYPSVRAPLAAFTNEERTADLSINVSATQWPDANTGVAKDFFKAALYNTFDSLTLISEGIKEINGKEYISFEFISRLYGKAGEAGLQSSIAKYTLLHYYIGSGRTLVFSFNCPLRVMENWQPIAREMLESVRIK